VSAWDDYKKKIGGVKPWDILNPNVSRASKEVEENRLSICLQCPELIKVTKQCKKCGCVMPVKVKLEQSKCPINLW